MDKNYKFTVKDRFLKYVKYDTQSDDNNSSNYPSSLGQIELLEALEIELIDLGVSNVKMDKYYYVTATIPATSTKVMPTLAFIAHVDTSDQASGKDIKPVIHENYNGQELKLINADRTISLEENPDLKNKIGHDIITSDGSTLLGSDDKAGIAEIMDMANYLMTHPEFKHGEIRICFTADEEIGNGVEYLDVKALNADYGYTLDGGEIGELEYENFNADMMVVKFFGKSIHPSIGKGKLINSVKVASKFIDSLPKDSLSPETTDGREGFVHCVGFEGNEELTTVKFIIRDFEEHKLADYENMLRKLAESVVKEFPGSKVETQVKEQYRNMKEIIDKNFITVEFAEIAMKDLGIKPIVQPIRGGTDGANLSFKGLPTPNLFPGQHNMHSRYEWISVQDMELTVRFVIELLSVWEERS